MFKRSYNRAVLALRIETVTPLLIRAGDPGLTPGPDLACVRTRHGRWGETVYVPGSSLKGVLRSAAEAAVRGQTFGGVEGACDPLSEESGCGFRIQKEDWRADGETARVHGAHCLACRTFGSTSLKGRTSVRDHYPIDPHELDSLEVFERANQTEGRHGVAINRVSGAAHGGALYDLEVVPAGACFFGDVAIENYQGWQLGLLASALDELNDGFAQLGSTKSRGLGVVSVAVTRVVHEQAPAGGEHPVGVGAMVEPGVADAYRLLPDGALGTPTGRVRGLSRRFELADPAAIEGFLDAGRTRLGGLS